MRKEPALGQLIEFSASTVPRNSIMRSDISVLVLDAEAGITEQTKKQPIES